MRIQGTGNSRKFDTVGWCFFYATLLGGIGLSLFGTWLDWLVQRRVIQPISFAVPFHFFVELTCIMLCFTVFLMSIYTHRFILNTKLLAAGFTLFATGVLDVVHLAGYIGFSLFPKPEEIVIRSALFIMLSHLICAIGLAVVCWVAEFRKLRIHTLFWFVFMLAILGAVSWLIAWDPLEIAWFNAVGQPGIILHLIRGMTIFLLFVAMFLTFRNYLIRPDRLQIEMAASFMLLISSEMLLMFLPQGVSYSESLSHLLNLVGLALLFDVFYIHGIRRPYVMLSEARDTLNQYANELDKQVEARTSELTQANGRLLADVELARDVQRSMLPSVLPHGDNVRFSAGYVPAEKLSGDFYNVFRIDSSRFGIYIGDVAGHGVSAAMLTVFAFQSVQSLQDESRGAAVILPSFVLKHLYESFNAANFQDEHYMVMLYGVYNMETGILSYASGGLNTTPIRVRPDGSIQMLESEGIAICKMGDFIKPQYQNKQLLLFPGDKLVLYTDGLVEARSPDHEVYSQERLADLIRTGANMDSDALVEMVLANVKAFTGLESPSDDITLLVMDVTLPF